MKKILFISRKYPPSVGGMEEGLYNISKYLPNEEFSVKVVALGKGQKNLIWFFPYILLYILFNSKKYDYLLLGDGVICICGKIARMVSSRIKRIIILHGLDVTYNNGIYQKYLRKNLSQSADKYACNSQYTEKIVREWGIKENVYTVRHGIDIYKFDKIKSIKNEEFRQRYSIDEGDLIILTVGRLVKRKGVEWFIRTVLPEISNITYIVIGEGEEKKNIENAIEDKQVSSKVRMLGKVSDEELGNCYLNSDVFVMPNFHVEDNAEGFGLVAVEASLAGLIVLASNVDGIPDAIIDRKNGFLIESKDGSTYQKYIHDIQNNKDKYKIIAEEHQKFTREHYSWENTCRQFRLLYKMLD